MGLINEIYTKIFKNPTEEKKSERLDLEEMLKFLESGSSDRFGAKPLIDDDGKIIGELIFYKDPEENKTNYNPSSA